MNLSIATLFKEAQKHIQQKVTVEGWVRTMRKSKSVCFVAINDGSTQNSLQLVVDSSLANYEEISSMITGFSVKAQGLLVASPAKGQPVEMQVQEVQILCKVSEEYPLQKKATSMEFLREVAHLRPRTNTFGAVFRLRHGLAFATHEFFHKNGFFYVNTPIVTSSDCEGAGEMFKVSTLKDGEKDYSKDFFGRPTYLTVSGQLSAECLAMGLGKVYTFGPTFRSENSNTPRHLAEFWMIEPEVAFADLNDNAKLAQDYLQYLLSFALENYPEELSFLQSQYEPGLIEKLTQVKSSPFARINYTDAIEVLKKSGKKFEFPVDWGKDLQTEHERFLAEEHFKTPVIVTDYPSAIKSFYMKENEDGKTVKAMDVLVPGVGEIIGGSQREDRLDVLMAKIKKMNLKEEDYWWYLDLRRFGSVPHSGFGLGFERAVMYVTGMTNIRDVIPFPRTPRNAQF